MENEVGQMRGGGVQRKIFTSGEAKDFVEGEDYKVGRVLRQVRRACPTGLGGVNQGVPPAPLAPANFREAKALPADLSEEQRRRQRQFGTWEVFQ